MIKGQAEPLVDGELHERVKVDDSFWNVEDNEYLNINLEKMEEKIIGIDLLQAFFGVSI